MKLHYLPPSANSHGPLAVIRDLEMEVELENCYGKTRTPEFIAMNPCHCAPTIELDDGTGIWESNAIMRFLCNSSPKGDKLYPTDPVKRAKVDMVLDWRQTTLYTKLPSIGYVVFGMKMDDDQAKKDFKELIDTHFETLCDTFLKDTKFCYSDTPTIADLAVAPPLTFIKARSKFWDAVPDKVKEYYAAVLEAFPATKENFDMLAGMAEKYDGAGSDLAPDL